MLQERDNQNKITDRNVPVSNVPVSTFPRSQFRPQVAINRNAFAQNRWQNNDFICRAGSM